MLRRFILAAAALLMATSAHAADSFTMTMAGDRFASVNLMVRVTAPNRAAYLQEGSQYKVAPDWQFVDSILCDQTTREMEVWVNPAATPRGAKMLVEFALVIAGQPVAQTAIERDMAGGTGRGFTHLVDRDFTLVINRTCR